MGYGQGIFSNFVSFKVGNGSCIQFCHDVWCGKATLKSSFPELYTIARDSLCVILLGTLWYLFSLESKFHHGNIGLRIGGCVC